MTEACRDWRPQLAALAVGDLDDGERPAVEAHLDGCPACRADLSRLKGVAAVLGAADLDRLADQPAPPTGLGAEVVARVGQELRARARRRRRSAAVVVTTSVVAAAALVLALVLLPTSPRTTTTAIPTTAPSATAPPPVPTSAPTGTSVALTSSVPGVSATALLEAKAWGTQVSLETVGLAGGQVQSVWLERVDGSRVAAGTFAGVEGRQLKVVLASALPRDQARAVGVSGPDGVVLLRASLG
ncbi:MAG: anti-sigma factor [Acidimicrobiales bacterium]